MPVWHPGLTEKQHYALELYPEGVKNYAGLYLFITCNIPELKLRREKNCLDFAKKL